MRTQAIRALPRSLSLRVPTSSLSLPPTTPTYCSTFRPLVPKSSIPGATPPLRPPMRLGFSRWGWAMGRLNGTPFAEVRTHYSVSPISGIIDDTAYGQYSIPAFTLDIGASLSPFCPDLDSIWAAQLAALTYAAKTLTSPPRLPLHDPSAPLPTPCCYTSRSRQCTGHRIISANYGTVAGAVYYVDDLDADGSGVPLTGNFGGPTANVSVIPDTTSLSNGRHLFLAQGTATTAAIGVSSHLPSSR